MSGYKGDPSHKSFYLDVEKTIKNWLYSFMTESGCESSGEYNMSKYLLIRFVTSEEVEEKLGPFFAKAFLLFFKETCTDT